MKVQVKKWGNSLAIRIPKLLADDVRISEGATVDLNVRDGDIVVKTRPHLALQDLLAGVRPANVPGEWETGRPVGREHW